MARRESQQRGVDRKIQQDDQFRFVSLLALELENGDTSLPSLPDVVMKIRSVLQSDNCDFEKISKAISIDPVLVSKPFVFANQQEHNRVLGFPDEVIESTDPATYVMYAYREKLTTMQQSLS